MVANGFNLYSIIFEFYPEGQVHILAPTLITLHPPSILLFCDKGYIQVVISILFILMDYHIMKQ